MPKGNSATRQCRKCAEKFLLDRGFHKDKNSPDGRKLYCKWCWAKMQRRYRRHSRPEGERVVITRKFVQDDHFYPQLAIFILMLVFIILLIVEHFG